MSHLWNYASIEAAKHTEFTKIKNLAKFLSENLQEETYSHQKKQLLDISNDTKILNSENLIQVKSSIHNLKEKFIDLLNDLNEKDLNCLEKLSKNTTKPQFFDNVFDIPEIFKKINIANATTDNGERECALYDISQELAKNDYISKAIEIANKISNTFALLDISKILAEKGNTDKAIEVAIRLTHYE